MAVAFRSSSRRGSGDTFSSNCVIPVPTGVAADDIIIAVVGQWSAGAHATTTPPTGFTSIGTLTFTTVKITAYWKRATGADTGNYTFVHSTANWTNGFAVAITGGVLTGDPIADFATGSSATASFPSVAVDTVTEPFLVWGSYNESSSTTTVPTGYTHTQTATIGALAYNIPGTTGTHTASGASVTAAMDLVEILVAVSPEAAAATTATAENIAVTGAAADAAVTVTDAPRPVRRMFAIPRGANF